jgi:hypothetical protein
VKSEERPAGALSTDDDYADDGTERSTVVLLDLRRPGRPAKPVSGLLARFLPDPLHEAGWRRFTGADLDELTPAERARELRALQVAIALMPDLGQVPGWVLARLAALECAS